MAGSRDGPWRGHHGGVGGGGGGGLGVEGDGPACRLHRSMTYPSQTRT
jgi:hypothetical protein